MGKKTDEPMTRSEALSRLTSLCSKSEHCLYQIKEKLREWNVSADDYSYIPYYLEKEKYIDQTRFARAYCHDKFCYDRWGRVKIRQMLRHYQLSDEDIAEGMSTISEDDYRQTLQDLLLAKNRTLRDTDIYLRKAKLMRHLLYKGFEPNLVSNAVEAFTD